MRILVTFAVDAEFAPWRKLRNLQKRTVEGLDIFTARIGRATVDFVVTGMGLERARQAVEVALRESYVHCIASGFAGGLNPSLKIGDIIAAAVVASSETTKTIECSRNLFRAAAQNQAFPATLLTVTKVVHTMEEKEQLRPFADAIDMESFAILSAAREHKISAAAVRVISDRFDEDMPANIDTTIDERGRVMVGGVIKHVATHPLQLPALIRLGRNSRTAAEALAHFLEAFIKELSFREHGWPPSELREVASR